MKKVPILTTDAVESRSITWNEAQEQFVIKISEEPGNSVTQKIDGLCVLGDPNGSTPANSPMRIRVKNNKIELPHFRLDLEDNAGLTASLFTNEDINNFWNMVITKEAVPTYVSKLESNPFYIGYGKAFRIAYEYYTISDERTRVMVMDVFLIPTDRPPSSGDHIDGFVDVLINANSFDFNLLTPPTET